MNKIINKLLRSFNRPIEIINNIFILPKLREKNVQNRFIYLCKQYSKVFSNFNSIETLERGSNGYSWDSWSGKIRSAFKKEVPLGFLSHPLIAYTMVLAGKGGAIQETRMRIAACSEILGIETTKSLLLEDFVGLPIISNSEFITSANRAHHSSHLAYYYKLTNKYLWQLGSIVEWGGGYGNMARILRRMNASLTYIIVDLPELLSLQYVYLASLEGEENINIITSKESSIITGKVNLVSSEFLMAGNYQIVCDAFISTWALTECPKYIQQYVSNNNFFNAREVFIASYIDDNNHLVGIDKQYCLQKLPIPFLTGNHEYWAFSVNAEN
jgi:hypothetical protein